MSTRLSIFGAAALVLASCSSQSSPDPQALAQQYCALVAPCCAAASLPPPGAQCQGMAMFAEQAVGGATFSACIDAMSAMKNDADFCPMLEGKAPQAVPAACPASHTSDAGVPSGTQPPGSTCVFDFDCAPGSGRAMCYMVGTGGSGTCVQMTSGSAGQGPCIATVQGSSVWTAWQQQMPPTTGYFCDLARGLYCDGASHTCSPQHASGGACSDDWDCTSGYCDGSTSRCAAPSPVGGPCSSDLGCTPPAHCDTGSSKCAAPGAAGATCTLDTDCTSSDYCDTSGDGSAWTCAARLPDGASCTFGGPECGVMSYCDDSTSKCTACAAGSTPTVCIHGGSDGGAGGAASGLAFVCGGGADGG